MSETIVGGKYRIGDLLGAGNMGSVYEAEHIHTRRRCAIKVISAPEMLEDPEAIGRFEREARAAGVVASRYIAQVFDAGVDEESGVPFLVMEYLEGEDLHDLIERLGPLPVDLALRIAAQACLGLTKAHEASVVHRDIKPPNLFLCLEDAGEVVVKLLDFGVAKVKMDQASTMAGAGLTAPGSVLGSPRYMSPEQALGKSDIDHRTDIWSLGAVLYEALCGHGPFHRPQTLAELIMAITSETPPSLGDEVPGLQPEVAALVHRCLEREREERFASAEELLDAIMPLLADGRSIHRDMLVSPSAALEGAPESTDEAAEQAQPTPKPTPTEATLDATVPAKPARLDGSADFGKTEPMAGAPPVTDSEAAAGASLSAPAASYRPAPGRRGASRWLAAAGLVVVAVVGAVLLSRWQPSDEVTASAANGAAPEPESGTSTASAASPPAADGDVRRVPLVVLPADASVEIDGKPASAVDGIVTIEGTLGHVYQVRVFKDDAETVADVVISHTGAVPPKVEVVPGRIVRVTAAGTRSTASPKATSTADVKVPGPVPKKPAGPLEMDSNIGEFQ